MPDPLAYFLTWRGYGTWLHGDDRGSVDRDHNQPCTPLLPRNPALENRIQDLMKDAPFLLNAQAREIVAATIRKHCEIRGWQLLALNARTTHVHVVVDCRAAASPETAMEQFKAWCTRRLREASLARPDQKVWGEHGSTQWIKSRSSLTEVIDYVTNRQ